ncbi:MAG: hypothetical protein C4526_07625 [Nitrospiraceae bacterium]|nr:MAG: hypothetical protein C4526_07625 [Nitrospiraceae bacterium]
MKLLNIFYAAPVVFVVLYGDVSAFEREYSINAETGIGYDSNAFLAPGKDYFDPVENGTIRPERRPGFFIPFSLEGEYGIGSTRAKLVSELEMSRRFYPGPRLNSADTYSTGLTTGLEYLMGKEGVYRDRVFIGPAVFYNKETYVDRDTGEERRTVTTSESLAERFTYYGYGLKAYLRVRTTPVRFAVRADVKEYDYREVPVFSSLDYLYYRAGGGVEFDISESTLLELDYDYYARDFRDRESRDLQGDLAEGTDRKYAYNEAGISLRQEVGRSWRIYFDSSRLSRDDRFAGYYDYVRDRFGVRVRYDDREGLKVKADAAWWERDYPNAFAFDDPAFPRKFDKAWEGKAGVEMTTSKTWKFWSEYEYTDRDSTDPRYDYRRHQISAGIGVTL